MGKITTWDERLFWEFVAFCFFLFYKVEGYKPWFETNPKNHGNEGPIHTSASEMAPISKLLLQAFQSKGLPLVSDMFSTGEVSHGCGYAVRSAQDGVRSTAGNYILNDNIQDRIKIKTNARVDKVLFEMIENEKRASGVEVVMEDGKR